MPFVSWAWLANIPLARIVAVPADVVGSFSLTVLLTKISSGRNAAHPRASKGMATAAARTRFLVCMTG